MRPSCDFDPGTIHPVEPPDERQYCGQISEFVRFGLPKDAPAGPPGAPYSRQLKPKDELGARQADIKTDLRKIAVAYPGLFRVCLIQQRAKRREVALRT